MPGHSPRSPSHGKCSRKYCGSSLNYGHSHHQRQRETFDGQRTKVDFGLGMGFGRL